MKSVNIKDYVFVGTRLYPNNVRINHNCVQWFDGNDEAQILFLPDGNYKYVGIGDRLTEEQWKEIVDRFNSSWGTNYYPEYPLEKRQGNKRTNPGFDTATESGHSLLKHHSMELNRTLIIKKII